MASARGKEARREQASRAAREQQHNLSPHNREIAATQSGELMEQNSIGPYAAASAPGTSAASNPDRVAATPDHVGRRILEGGSAGHLKQYALTQYNMNLGFAQNGWEPPSYDQLIQGWYTEAEVDNFLGGKSNVGHTHTQYLTKSEGDSLYSALGHTHSQYLTEAEGNTLYVNHGQTVHGQAHSFATAALVLGAVLSYPTAPEMAWAFVYILAVMLALQGILAIARALRCGISSAGDDRGDDRADGG